MTQFTFIGVDIAKDKFDVSALINDKNKHSTFSNDTKGFEKFLLWVADYFLQDLWVGMEATGHYSEALAEFLSQRNIHVSIINPMQIKNFAKATLKRNKNDIIDARLVREYVSVMKPHIFQPRPAQQKEVRELVQLQESLKEELTRFKYKLASMQSPVAQEEAKEIIQSIKQSIEELSQKIKASVEKNPEMRKMVELLMSIKGIGETSAYRLISLLPNITLFKSAKQLAAFMGLTPKQNESGNWKGKTSLSKWGDARLRKTLYMPALSAKNKNEYLQPFVTRLEKTGLKPKAIVGAVMRKLAHIIFGILKSQQPFNPKLI